LIPASSADELLVAMAEHDIAKVIGLVEEFYRLGRDPRSLIESLLHRLADLTRAAYGMRVGEGPDAALESALVATAARLGKNNVLTFRSGLADANRYVREVSLPRVWLEAELLRLAQASHADAPPADESRVDQASRVAAVRPRPRDEASTTTTAAPIQPTPCEPAVSVPAPAPITEEPAAFDGSLESAQVVWRQLVARLAEKHTRAGMKLARTVIRSTDDAEWVVAVARQMDYDFIQAHPKAREAILNALHEHPGTADVRLQYVLDTSKATLRPANEAVELPSEGEQLAELAREVFGEA
jgi:DNA polymerase-3 subunit gamma/tau